MNPSTSWGGPAGRQLRRATAAGRPPADLRQLIPSGPSDQGRNRPLCLPFALTGAHEADPSATAPLAPEPIWWRCHQLKQAGPNGTLLEHAGVTLADIGQVELANWPYDPTLGYGTENPPADCGAPPWKCARYTEIQLAHDAIEDEIEDRLADGYPVVLVVELTDEFYEPGEDGYVEPPSIRSAAQEYHAVLVVGARTDEARGRHLLIRNSWGRGWGLGGYCWLPMQYLVAFATEAAFVEA